MPPHFDRAKAIARPVLRRFFEPLRARRADLFEIRRGRPPRPGVRSGDGAQTAAAGAATCDDPERLLETLPIGEALRHPGHPRSSGRHAFSGYAPERVDAVLDRIRLFRGAPSFEILTDVVYMPELHCLYSRDGERIDASYLRAGAGPAPRAPEQIAVPRGLPRCAEPFIYVGAMSNHHYGHFLTESTSRLWYALREPGPRVLSHPLDRFDLRRSFMDVVFEAAGVRAARFCWLDRPTLLEQVVLPRPAFTTTPTIRDAYDAHRVLFEAAARRLLRGSPAQPDGRPLYLSRSRLAAGRRQAHGERAFEQELRGAGFAVVAPERLPLAEQIRLVNAHPVVVGTLGSALHSLLFDVSGQRACICLGYADTPHPNYLMIEALKGVRSLHVAALAEPDGAGGSYSHRDRALDVERARAALRSWNLL